MVFAAGETKSLIDFLRDGLLDSRALNLVTPIDQPPLKRRMAMSWTPTDIPCRLSTGWQALTQYNGYPSPPLALLAASGSATSA